MYHKKRSRPLLRLVVLLLLAAGIAYLGYALYGRPSQGDEMDAVVPGFYEGDTKALTLENDQLLLTMDSQTSFFTITNKADGKVWHAVPPDASQDPLALAGTKNLLQSTLALTYATNRGVRTLFDSYEYSIKNQSYQIEATADSITIHYTLGRVQKEYIIPHVISQSRMEAYLEKLTKAQGRKVLDSYRKQDPARIKPENMEQMLENYPLLAEGPIFVLRDNVKDFLKAEFQDLFEVAGYTFEDYQGDQMGGASMSSRGAVFTLSVNYHLVDNDLLVTVPLQGLRYLPDYLPIRLSILPNFGAGSQQDSGFMLLPEGGGAIINFNNGKTNQNPYFANVYGWDYASMRDTVVHETNASFPFFGLASGGSSFLCMMEEGASYAALSADIAGRGTSYNTVSASFALLHYDAFQVTERTIETIYMYQEHLPEENISLRYRFLASDQLGEMANAYGDYLSQRYPDWQTPTSNKLPLSIEVLGAMDKVQQRGGLPLSTPIRLTSYQETADILSEVAGYADADVHLRLLGWANGGLRQKLLRGIHLQPQLGTQEDFDHLLARARDQGVTLHLGGITSFALDSNLSDGFLAIRDAARFTTRERVELHPYSTLWYGEMSLREPYHLLRPSLADQMLGNLADYAAQQGAGGIALEDVGLLLSADYDPKNLVTREQVLARQASSLVALKAAGQSVMVRGGNLYALPGASLVTDFKLYGSDYGILDDLPPFIPMALHGRLAYTGSALNLSGDWQQELLLSAQRGAGLSFTFMMEDSEVLHDSDYARYYGASYGLWKDRAKDIITSYQAAMEGLHQQRIIGFEEPAPGLSITSFVGGAQVLVNFTEQDAQVAGHLLPARSYLTVRPGGAP